LKSMLSVDDMPLKVGRLQYCEHQQGLLGHSSIQSMMLKKLTRVCEHDLGGSVRWIVWMEEMTFRVYL
jgi:hypothetical protein